MPDPDQRFGLGIRQRLDQDRLHHAKDGGGRTDAQRERNQRDSGEHRSALQPAQDVFE